MSFIALQKPRVDPVSFIYKFHTIVEVLRLDLVHPVVSGNKWFKLKFYLEEALTQKKKAILSFGGAWSNHIVATAAAASSAGLQSIGIIRGEKLSAPSSALQDALAYGMKLVFVSREDYRQKLIPDSAFHEYGKDAVYLIPEGGYGPQGVRGAAEILKELDASRYTHILAAAGTGATLAGLAAASAENQQVIGISVLKNNFSLERDIKRLLPEARQNCFTLLHDYHFGGYAKQSVKVFDFMNYWYEKTGIPSDFVYTGKLFYAADDLIRKNFFPPNSRILLLHTGGLQGNRSLNSALLAFRYWIKYPYVD